MSVMLMLCGCTNDEIENPSISPLEKNIEDSLRTMNIPYVKQMIQRGKDESKDKDEYYKFVMYDAITYFYTAETDSMLLCVDNTLKYLDSVPDTRQRNKLRIKCLQSKGAYYAQYYANIDSLLYYSIAACKIAKRNADPEDLLLCYGNLADAYKQKGDLVSSAETYRQAISFADSIHTERENYVPFYMGLASTYTSLHDFYRSKVWWDKSYELWNLMMTREQFNYLNNRGNDYYYQEKYDSCLNMFLRLDSFLLKHDDMLWERQFCHVNLTDVYLKLGQMQKADSLLRETYGFFAPTNNDIVLSYLNTQKMELAFKLGHNEDVRKLIHDNPTTGGLRVENQLPRMEFLNRFYVSQKQWDSAYHYLSMCNEINDSLRSENIRMRVADLQLQYERDTTVLSQNVYIAQQENSLIRIQTWLLLAVLLIVLAVFAIYYFIRRSRAREEQMLHRIVELRMENVRNRITPHFIYNALNHELLAQKQGKGSQMNVLVNLLQQEQALANEFCTSLKEELDFIRLYVEIEKEAIGGELDYRVFMDDGLQPENIKLPSMMIQIFVENAIKHGLKDMVQDVEKKLYIYVRHMDNGCFSISVCNNGKPYDMRGYGKSRTGFKVVSQTIQILNERNKKQMIYSISDYSEDMKEKGCCAQLIIPEDYNFNIK